MLGDGGFGGGRGGVFRSGVSFDVQVDCGGMRWSRYRFKQESYA